MASSTSTVIPIMDEFNTREMLARNIKRDIRTLLIATAESVSKHPVCWSDVRALLPIPIDKSLAMMLVAETGVVEQWDV